MYASEYHWYKDVILIMEHLTSFVTRGTGNTLQRVHLLYVGLISLYITAINAYELPLKRGTPTQSSSARQGGPKFYGAIRAIDGMLGSLTPKFELSGCAHTLNDAKAWWKIRMDKVYVVRSVTIYNTFTAPNRMQRLNITVGMASELARQSLCKYYDQTVPAGGSAAIVCTQEMNGSYIGIQKTSSTTYSASGSVIRKDDGYLTLCEVEASGYEVCSGNFFGLGCNTTCNCQVKCDDETGICPGGGCEAGYFGAKCQKRITCGHPGHVTHATVSGSYLYKDIVTYKCVRGYEIQNGDAQRTCQSSKRWSGQQPTCERITCGHPGHIPHATVSGSYLYEDNVTYTCVPGYEIRSGNAQRTCLSWKRWSGKQPTCGNENECLGEPCKNGGTCLNTVGSYKCQCMEGYRGNLCDEAHVQCIVIDRHIGSVIGSFIAGMALSGLIFLITYLIKRRRRRGKGDSIKTSRKNDGNRNNSQSQADIYEGGSLQSTNSPNARHDAEGEHGVETGGHVYHKLDTESLSVAMYQNVTSESPNVPMYQSLSL